MIVGERRVLVSRHGYGALLTGIDTAPAVALHKPALLPAEKKLLFLFQPLREMCIRDRIYLGLISAGAAAMIEVKCLWVLGPTTVSYTHLDVYKRQRKDCPAAM